MFDRPRATLERWDAMSAQSRPLAAIAGADAHARLGWQEQEDGGKGSEPDASPAVPSYENMFRVLSTTVELSAPLTGRAGEDARHVIEALASGRSYTTIDAYARGGGLEFAGETGSGRVTMGDRVGRGELMRLSVRVRAPVNAIVRLLRTARRSPRPPA